MIFNSSGSLKLPKSAGLVFARLSRDLPPRQRSLARSYYVAAQARRTAAQRLFDARMFVASLVLYQGAAALFAKCYLVAEAADSDTDTLNALTEASAVQSLFEALSAAPDLRPKALSEMAPFGSTLSLNLDQLPPSELRSRVEALDTLCQELAELTEPRSHQEHRLATNRRWAMVATLLVVPVVAWGVYKMTAPTNVALHKAVTASNAAFDTKPEQAVDGKRYGTYGFHSEQSDSPWLTVDLGALYAIGEIDVYGRHDCCFDQSIPMVVEYSSDNQTFKVIEQRDAPMDHVEPWTLKPTLVAARFIRVRTIRSSYLVLSEIEVQGRRLD